jgi:hypothetical protein
VDRVNIKNLAQTMRLLKEYEPDLAKQIQKRIRGAANEVATEARADIETGNALGNWGAWLERKSGRDLGFDGARARKDIRVTRAAMRRRGMIVSNYIGVVSDKPATVIWHTAGLAASNRYNATGAKGLTFRANMVKNFPGKRGIWKAYDANEGKAQRQIVAAAREAERYVQRALNRLGD